MKQKSNLSLFKPRAQPQISDNEERKPQRPRRGHVLSGWVLRPRATAGGWTGTSERREGTPNAPLGRGERRRGLAPAKSQQSPWDKAEVTLRAAVPASPAGCPVCRPGVMTAADDSCDMLRTGSGACRTSIRNPVSQADVVACATHQARLVMRHVLRVRKDSKVRGEAGSWGGGGRSTQSKLIPHRPSQI